MSTTIDQQVVEMRFDNKRFESNIATTMESLEKFKQKLNMNGATKGLEEIDAAAKRVDMSGLGTAVDTVGVRFNALWTIADQALRNITNSVYNTGQRILSSLTIEPIKTGLQEYETQINAVQTILANTESKGTTLEDVNGALDTLNTYADKTIYNFTEMTRNIGTFTAAGVDLDTSVNAIQGIANLAAVSGSSSQQASTAMYQLSQALASGTVKLMDWNSVVNAGMGGQVFQDALKETARVHGVNIDAMIKKNGSFRETLQEGWLTADILTETLSHFTMAAEEGSEQWNQYKKSLMDSGYSEEQANAILKLSNTATDAATKVKTATQLMDTLKETAQSGWTQTWELIFGDFEDAKTLFSELYETLAPILEASAKARNELLQGWAEAGGRDDLIQSLRNVFDAIGSVVKPIKEAFREIFPPATAEQLVNITEAIKNFTERLKLSDTASDNLKRTFKGLFAIVDIVRQVFVAVFKAIGPLFGKVDDLGGGILGVTAKFGDWLVKLNESIKASGFLAKAVDVIHKALKKIGEFLSPVIEGFKRFGNEVAKNLTAVSDNAEERLGPLSTLGKFILGVFVGIGNVIKKIFPFISAAATGIGKVLGDLMNRISDSIQNADYESFFDLTSGGILAAIGVFIAKFMKSGSDILDGAGGFLENINGILEGVGDALGAFTDSLKADTLKKIATAIAILAASLLVLSLIPSEKLTTALVAITTLFGELMGSMAIFGKMGDLKGVAKLATAMISLSAALLVLSVALKIMSTMSWSEMGVGLISMTVGIGALVAAVNLLPESKVKGAAKAIKKLSTAILILAVGIKIMSTMSWQEMGVGLITMVVGLGALVGAVNLLPKDTAIRAAGMIGLATAMVVLAGALKIMATMSWNDVAKSLVTLAGSLGILAGAMALMKSAIPGAAAMLIVAPALVILAGALKIMATMSWEEIAKGLVMLAGSLLIISGAMALMKSAISGAAALLVVSAALLVLTPVLKTLGSMSLAEIGKSLLMLAGVFAVLGLSALVLQPLVPTILALSGALALFGVACVAIGAGVLLIGVGLTALAAALAASGGAITVFVASIISLIPYLIEQIGVGIIKLCEVIAGSAAAICDAATVIILALVDALVASVPHLVDGALVLISELLASLVEYTPVIVSALFDLLIGIINAIAAKLPDLIQACVNLVMSLLTGVIEALKSIDTNVLVNGILAIGLITAFMAALSLIATLAPGAMAGVLALAAIIAELGIVLAAFGALAKIPGLIELIEGGGNLLQSIGTAIGQFIGGLVGGIGQGISGSLPQIGSDLSAFMTNAKPFIDGAKSIDSSMMDGVKAIIGVITALTAVDILQGLTSWVTGGSSLTKFGEELAAFGPHMKSYADSISGIDAKAVTASATAAEALAEMTSCIPNEGGMVAWFTGENSISKFGTELVTLGQGLRAYSASIVGFNAGAVIASANAATALVEMTEKIPNEGGMVAWFTGDNSITKFGNELVILGRCLSAYSASIALFNADAVIASTNAATALVEMTSKIPNEGGMVAWFTGENSIVKFGNELVLLGSSLKAYSDVIAGFNADAVIASANAATALVDMTGKIPNEGGMVAWFTGENSISKFGTELVSLGGSLKLFSDSVSGLNSNNVITAANAASALATMANTIPNEGGMVAWFTGENSMSKFGNDLILLGQGLKGFSDAIAGINTANVSAAAQAASNIATMCNTIPNEGGMKAWFSGESGLASFAANLAPLGQGLKGFSDAVTGIDATSVTAAVTVATGLSDLTKNLPTEGGFKALFTGEQSLSNFGEDLKAFGGSIKGFADSVAGIDSEAVKNALWVAQSIVSLTYTSSDLNKISTMGIEINQFANHFSVAYATLSTLDGTKLNLAIYTVRQIVGLGNLDVSKFEDLGNAMKDLSYGVRSIVSVNSKSVTDMVDALNDLATINVGDIASTLNSLGTEMESMGKSFVNRFVSGVKGEEAMGVADTAGKALGDAVVKGLESKEKRIKTAGEDFADRGADGASNSKSDFEDAGKDLGDGLVKGINAKKQAAYDAGYALGQKAVQGERDGQRSASPSKETIQSGEWLGEGLIIGMAHLMRQVYNSGFSLGENATKSISTAISRISDAINSDIDAQPTIRPVLDLSNIKTGTRALSGMLDMGSTVNIRTNLGAISSMMSGRGQNGGNGDIVSAIDKLSKKMDNINNASYVINGVTYDDGSNISDAVGAIVRAARIERRV